MTSAGLEAELRAVDEATASFGPKHPETLRALGDLAEAQSAIGDDVAASETLSSTLAAWEQLGAEGEVGAIQTEHVLAQVRFRLGDLNGARLAQERVVAAVETTFGIDNDTGVQALSDLAATNMAMGRIESALALQARRASVIAVLDGPASRRALQARATVAMTLRKLGRFAEALEVDAQALEEAEAVPLDLRFLLDSRRHLIEDFAGLKDWTSAARVLVELFDLGMAGLEETDDLRVYLEEYRLVFEELACDLQRNKVRKGTVVILMRGGLLASWVGRRR
jgi:tetratricopeptide (TPR) repeat protein